MNKLYMMVGIPASGKSYNAAIIAERENAVLYSSDDIRALTGLKDADKTDNSKLFAEINRQVINDLAEGKNVVYDATNLSAKKRRGFLKQLSKLKIEKICVLVLRQFVNCVNANEMRKKPVPYQDMRRMYLSFQIPSYTEGWDKIITIYTDNDETILGKPEEFVNNLVNFKQDNPHHQLTLGNHMLNAYASVETTDEEVKTATLIHDIGKPFTKTFKNSKGEDTPEAHYYNHENVGAYLTMFLDLGKMDKLHIAFLVNNHMRPFYWTEKSSERDLNNWGEKLFNEISTIHRADMENKTED